MERYLDSYMEVYSHSRLKTFEQCKLKYKYQYIDRIRTGKTTIEAFMGDMVHQVLEKLYKDIKYQKKPELKELLSFYNKLWQDNWEDTITVVKDYTPENYRKMGEKFVTDFFNGKKPFDRAKTLGLETTSVVEIAPDIGYHIRIDRLALNGDVYEVHDYKTSNSLPTKKDLEEDMQLAMYTYGLKKLYPVKKAKQIWHYLAFDQDVYTEKTEDEILQVKEKVLETIDKINECQDYPAQASALCSWCEYREMCPKFRHLYQEESVQEGGTELVDKYAEIKEKLSSLEEEKEQIKQKLIKYSKQHDLKNVYGTNHRASIYCYERMSFPRKNDPRRSAFFETLRKVGLWEELEIADVYELTKRINKNKIPKNIVDELDRFIEKSDYAKIYLNKR